MADITWTPVEIALRDLTPWERNPKRISKAHATRLLDLWQRLGQFQTIAIGPAGEVYDGHQRLSVLKVKHGAGYVVQALQSSRALTEAEREELTIAAHVGTVGQFDWDALSGWDAWSLQSWGLDADTLAGWNTDAAALATMLEAEDEPDETYSRKIESPVYQPTGDKPEITELYDDTRTKELEAEIEASSLPDDVKQFLSIAAKRHTVLHFNRIAEYYAHADEGLQALMENSALVIIDFNRAIELGFVKLSEEIAKLYGEDYPDA